MYRNSDTGRTATIEDVARHAGVSRAAVSKVLRNAYGVSDAMRARVSVAIEELDYRPSVAARTMRGSSFTIGIEMPAMGNPFLSKVLEGASRALAETDYQLIVAPTRSESDSLKSMQALQDRHVDGIIAIAPLAPAPWLTSLARRTPLVLLGRHEENVPYDVVVCDDQLGTAEALEHLWDLGHRRIAHLTRSEDVTHPDTHSPHSVRLRAYEEFMNQHGAGDAVNILRTPSREADALLVVQNALATLDHPTAIFAGNDELALGALHATHVAGLGPAQVSVVGYDDIDMAAHPAISLTTVDQHGVEMGDAAVEMLLERITGRDLPRRFVSQPALRIRSSSAPLNITKREAAPLLSGL